MPASDMVAFGTVEEARSAYYNGTWAEPSETGTLEGGWSLLEQGMADSGRTRYFVLVGPADTPQAMTQGGGTEEITGELSLDEFNSLPAFDSEDGAREAHQTWLEANSDYQSDGNENSSWTGWATYDEFPPWYVLVRQDEESNAAQFLIAGERDGSNIYLAPGPEIVDSAPEPFEAEENVIIALEAYFAEIESGDRDPANGPSGKPPSIDQVDSETSEPSSGSIVGTITANPMISLGVVLVVIVAYYYMRNR